MKRFIFHRKALLLTLCVMTLYGIITFLYLEVSIAIQSSQIIRIADFQLNLMKLSNFNISKFSDGRSCPINTIRPGRKTDVDAMVRCKQHEPSRAACAYTREFYKYDFQHWKCDETKELRLCEITRDGTIICDYKQCGQTFKGEVVAHLFDKESGFVRPLQQGFSNNNDLNGHISEIAYKAMSEGYPFLFVSCGFDEQRTQLLILDNSMTPDKHNLKSLTNDVSKININIILFDSISRAHFYRSLKKTVDFLVQVNKDSKIKAEILDYELFQSVHGHTTENLYALMNGRIFLSTLTDHEKENEVTRFQNMLRFMKKNGYETLYQEDECWEGMWGLNSDLGSFERWTDLREEIKVNASIDDTGLLFASCKIIDIFEPQNKHVFNTGSESKLCYNGFNMDSYYLQYLSTKIQQTKHNLFSFTAINIAHDGTGKRVQGIDEDLRLFFKQMTQVDDTITIVFADHGNTYTDFVFSDIEGRYEMYHPALFIVLPENVKRKLGTYKVNALRTNQNRLINLIDIHHAIKHIANPEETSKKGILEILPANRTCDSIPLSKPNLCLCNNWESPVENTTDYMPYVDFAIGKINNIITEASKGGKCKRLVPTRFENVLQRKNGGLVTLKFDIFSTPGRGSKNKNEQISAVVNYFESDEYTTFNAKLISYDRISKFGQYRKCSDTSPKFRFCVCNMDPSNSTSGILSNPQDLSPVRNEYLYTAIFGDKIDERILFVDDHKRLGLLERRIFDPKQVNNTMLVAVSFEVMSFVNSTFRFSLIFDSLRNMKPMSRGDCSDVVKGYKMAYLCTLRRVWSISSADYMFSFSFKEIL